MFSTVTRARRGFTLMELAIIIAIVGILAAVGAVKYASMSDDAKAAGAQAALANARSAFAIAIAKDSDGKISMAEYAGFLEGTATPSGMTVTMDSKYKVTLLGTTSAVIGIDKVEAI